MTKFPPCGEVVRVHFGGDPGGMFGYYDHKNKQWWVQDAGSFRKPFAEPLAWSPVSTNWHDVSKTTPGDTEKTVLFYRSGDDGTWVGKWADRCYATHWIELPDPPTPKPQFVVGGVYAMPGLPGTIARITDIVTLNGKTILFGRYSDDGRPGVWDAAGHALPFEPHDKLCDLVLS